VPLPEPVELTAAPEQALPPQPPAVPEAVVLPETPPAVELPVSPAEKIEPEVTVKDETFVRSETPDIAAPPEMAESDSVSDVVSAVAEQTSEPSSVATKEQVEEERIIEEILEFAEPASPQQVEQIRPVVVTDEDLQDDDVLALLGENTVAALVAQPEIPQELRPPGIPVVRPGRITDQRPAIDEGLLLTSLPEPIEQKQPEPLPKLLPDPEQDRGVLYIVPFVAIMVPKEVNDRIFDRFVDSLLEQSENLELEIVILKDGLKGIDPPWLSARKYVTGEIYGYIEEAGSDVIDLRAKAKLNYHTPNQDAPTFSYLYPVSKFLDRNSTIIEEERIQLADNIAETLITEFLGVLKN
jgi:hypothetical protein